SREQSARLSWQCFHCQGRAQPPFAAHADPIKSAKNQQHTEIGRKRCEQFHERIKNDVDHQWNSPPKAVAQQAEDERAHGAHRQRDSNRVTEISDARAEILCHRHNHKRQEKKIERVQRPPQKTGEKRVALIAVEKFKEPDRFHSVFQLFAWLLYRKLEPQEAAIVREVTAVLLTIAGLFRGDASTTSLYRSRQTCWLPASLRRVDRN